MGFFTLNLLLVSNKSCISLAIVHSKGIPLVKPYFDHIGSVSHSVE